MTQRHYALIRLLCALGFILTALTVRIVTLYHPTP